MPAEVSQSHTSVPSRSMARMRYPPPGNTTTAAPLLLPAGVYRVIVGEDTLVRRTSGFPAIRLSLAEVASTSDPGFDWGCGHRGRVIWPGVGSQADFWANKPTDRPAMAARTSRCMRMIRVSIIGVAAMMAAGARLGNKKCTFRRKLRLLCLRPKHSERCGERSQHEPLPLLPLP